jgi:WD40 repeat protein
VNDNLIPLSEWPTNLAEKLKPQPDQPVIIKAFSPDSKMLVSGSEDGNMKLWDSLSGETKLTVVVSENDATVNQ